MTSDEAAESHLEAPRRREGDHFGEPSRHHLNRPAEDPAEGPAQDWALQVNRVKQLHADAANDEIIQLPFKVVITVNHHLIRANVCLVRIRHVATYLKHQTSTLRESFRGMNQDSAVQTIHDPSVWEPHTAYNEGLTLILCSFWC